MRSSDSINQIIASNIARLRELRGLTQLELGLALGYKEENAQSRISQYEKKPNQKGARSPSKETLENIARQLNVSVEDLLRVESDGHEIKGKVESLDLASKRLIAIFKQLDIDSKRAVLRYAEERIKLMRINKKK